MLSAPQIHYLLDSIDAKRLPHDAAVIESLLQTAGFAAARHDVRARSRLSPNMSIETRNTRRPWRRPLFSVRFRVT